MANEGWQSAVQEMLAKGSQENYKLEKKKHNQMYDIKTSHFPLFTFNYFSF